MTDTRDARPSGPIDLRSMTNRTVLDVKDLTVRFYGDRSTVTVVEHVSLWVSGGETLGLVGESGSGKTVTTQAMMGLVDPMQGDVTGTVLLDGESLLDLPPKRQRSTRRRHVGMIFQEPMRSLDPAFTVGDQIAEVARAQLGLSRRDAWARAVEMLDRVEIARAARRARDFPHMLSGGMCQRVMIAMAIVCHPILLVADEPTTALDVTVQAQILDLMRSLQESTGIAIVFVTHDLGVVAEMCDRIAVMYAGQIVEERRSEQLFRDPRHPYTEGLLGAIPDTHIRDKRMRAIRGTVPSPGAWPAGCRFRGRCPYGLDVCAEADPMLHEVVAGCSRCIREAEITLKGVS
jgi:oligopeptide/dipeptide ABC transporter ATP-binding protein